MTTNENDERQETNVNTKTTSQHFKKVNGGYLILLSMTSELYYKEGVVEWEGQ